MIDAQATPRELGPRNLLAYRELYLRAIAPSMKSIFKIPKVPSLDFSIHDSILNP